MFRSRQNQVMDWDEVDASALFEAIRADAPPADAERMIWALKHILAAARIDPGARPLRRRGDLRVAYRDSETPKVVLEHLVRRSVSDEEWESEYATLLPTAPG